MQASGSALHQLASVLRASPESDALVILGRLLDSLPIGFHVTDCSDSFRIVYGNQVWDRWLGPDRLPVVGKPLDQVFPTAAQSGVLDIMRDVRQTGQPRHLKGFEFRELGTVARGRADETSRWDWEIYPFTGPTGDVTHLLNVVMDVSEAPSPEETSGVLRLDSRSRRAHALRPGRWPDVTAPRRCADRRADGDPRRAARFDVHR